MSQNKKITDPPRTVKEAIDWLLRIGELDNSSSGAGSSRNTNSSAIEKAVKALTGSNRGLERDIQTLISDLSKFIGYKNGSVSGSSIIKKNSGSTYSSAYSTTVTWPTCKSGQQCSCCTQNGSCKCSTGTSSCNGTCCNTCDIRICAGIFVALVPALEKALRELKDKLKKENGKTINDLKEHFTALGYEDKDLNDKLQASHVNSKISTAINQLGDLKKKILGSYGYFKGIENSATNAVAPSPSSTSSATPTSIREMLLWLMGLPYCQNYKDLVDALKNKTNDVLGSSTRSSKQDENPFAKQLSAVIFQLPTVFYSVEGHISYLNEVFDQFKNGGQVKFNYPTTNSGTDMLNTLSAYVAVCYPILKYLMQRCDKENQSSRRRTRSAGAQTSTPNAEENDGSWGELLVSGQENNTVQEKSRAASGSSAPPTALRDYLVFMGFNASNNKVTGDELYEKALKECFSASMKTEDEDDDEAGTLALSRSRRSTTSKDQKLPALRKLAKKVLQEAYKSGSGSHAPTTIRQMMLWLIGLPLTTAYKSSSGTSPPGPAAGTGALFGNNSRVLQEINQNAELKDLEQGQQQRRLRHSTSTTATGKHFKQQLKDSIVGMIMLFQRIEGGLGSVLDFLKEGFKDGSKFKYDGFNGDESLLKVFSSYVYKVHVQLRFLKVMCKTEKANGGWKECYYTDTSGSGVGDKITCGCSYSDPCCALPLKHFLTNNGNNNGGSGANGNKFKLCDGSNEKYAMGFDAKHLTKNGSKTGYNIYTYLEALLDPIPTTATQPSSQSTPSSKPLSLLTQYCVAIGNMDPVSLGDHFDVFRELAGDGMWSKIEGEVKKEIKLITTADTDGSQASDKLKTALQAVWPDQHTEHNDSGDLVSLTGCNGGSSNNCIPFIATLSHGLYSFFDPTKLSSPANKIDWLYMKMSSLYGKLTALKTEMTEKCKCCQEGQSSSSCQGIIKCPNCLPQLYKMGLVFGDPVTISTNKCSELMDMMENVLVTTTSKLCVVFRSIDDKRFWPYLLFASHVVHGKKLQVTGDDNYNCYTYELAKEYQKYLEEKQEADKKQAEKNKGTRDTALKCTCSSHQYTAPQTKQVTPTVVTLTLYFHKDGVTTIQLVVPFHGPDFNPLVRFYPRNLKSIVDWLLRIGQTRLGQDTSGASTEEMCDNLWPRIQGYVTGMDQEHFKLLVTNVMKLMGLENKGKNDVNNEVKKALKEVTEKLNKKLNGNGDGFDKTFQSILTFKPNAYIDKVIEDFGKKPSTLTVNSNGNRSFNCIAASVNKCMSTALQTIKTLVEQNKEALKNYNSYTQQDIEDISNGVTELNTLGKLKELCDAFSKFYISYDTVWKPIEAAFTQVSQDTNNDGKTLWEAIQKYTGAFYYVSEVSTHVKRLERDSTMGGSYDSLEILIQKLTELERHNGSLNGDGDKVTQFIKKVQDKLTEIGKENIEKALNMKNGGTKFEDVVKMFLSTVVDNYKSKADVIDKIFYHLPVFSECLKAMVQIYNTGMKEFIKELKKSLETAKGHINKIHVLQIQLKELQRLTGCINGSEKEYYENDGMALTLQKTVQSIKELLKNEYIYQTQPIVSNFINNDATEKMTTYLRSLPDLIRDRYVLQKWKDSPEHFCGVQEFKDGIVKPSGITGITDKLKDLLKEAFHTSDQFPVTIHTFQVKSLIYNFCHKEAMEKIGSGVRLLYFVSHYVNNGNGSLEWNNIKNNGTKGQLEPILKDICGNSYLRYFATHLRDSIGYHTLSNTLGALEQVKTALGNNGSSEPSNWNEISKLLKKDNLDPLYQRLQALLDKLHREYIFEYPPFDWTKSCHRVVAPTGASRTRRAAPAPQVSPSTPSDTCDLCVPSMAYIFIGFVPQMYRLFKMLREMTKDGHQHKLVYQNNGRDETTTTMSSLAGFFESEGWRLKIEGKVTGVDEAYDLDHAKRGNDVCTLLEEIIGNKEPGALVATGEASTADSLKPLDQLFKAVMQHFKDERKKKRQQREEKLKQEFDEKYKDSGLKFLAPPPVLPSTVRQVLFWLHEMDTNKAFYDGLSEHINTLCTAASPTVTISQDTILHVLKLSATQCLEVLATIEDPGRQNADYLYELYTEEHYYAYPTVNIPLFFYTFVEKLMGAFLELNFVCVQCEFRATEGGWKDCHIGEVYNKAYDISGGTSCICHERKLAGPPMLRVEVEGSLVCPKPLSAFLFSDPKNQLRIPSDVSQRLVYMSKGTMPCGFQLKNKAITDAATKGDAQSALTAPTPTSVSGSVLVEPLRKLVGGHVKGRLNDKQVNTLSTVIYLRDLLRYVLCLAVRPPWSMSENMAFFYRLTESWKKNNNVVGGVALGNDNLLGAIHAEIDMFPGSFEGTQLTSAVERFAGIEDTEHQKSKTSASASPSGSHHYDLRTLMGCQEANATRSGTPAQCSPFMFPLSLDVYTHYDHKNSRAYLSWILNFAFGIYGQLKALEEMMKEQKCMRNASSNTSPCPSLPMCPGVLTALYQSGSSFMDQRQLAKENTNTRGTNTTRKTCNDFKTVLTGLFNCNTASCSPLHNLIVQCEAFLWSIRLPFSLVQLSLWSVAILFISYVFVVPLDHFKIKSHLFNRLKYTMHPSLLIADQQRRVSEVAYFSL